MRRACPRACVSAGALQGCTPSRSALAGGNPAPVMHMDVCLCDERCSHHAFYFTYRARPPSLPFPLPGLLANGGIVHQRGRSAHARQGSCPSHPPFRPPFLPVWLISASRQGSFCPSGQAQAPCSDPLAPVWYPLSHSLSETTLFAFFRRLFSSRLLSRDCFQ